MSLTFLSIQQKKEKNARTLLLKSVRINFMIFFLQQSYVRHTAVLFVVHQGISGTYLLLYDTTNFMQSPRSTLGSEFLC